MNYMSIEYIGGIYRNPGPWWRSYTSSHKHRDNNIGSKYVPYLISALEFYNYLHAWNEHATR